MEQIVNIVSGLDLKAVLLLIVAILEAFLRLKPTKQNYSIIDKILNFIKFILNFVLPNIKKEGGKYE